MEGDSPLEVFADEIFFASATSSLGIDSDAVVCPVTVVGEITMNYVTIAEAVDSIIPEEKITLDEMKASLETEIRMEGGPEYTFLQLLDDLRLKKEALEEFRRNGQGNSLPSRRLHEAIERLENLKGAYNDWEGKMDCFLESEAGIVRDKLAKLWEEIKASLAEELLGGYEGLCDTIRSVEEEHDNFIRRGAEKSRLALSLHDDKVRLLTLRQKYDKYQRELINFEEQNMQVSKKLKFRQLQQLKLSVDSVAIEISEELDQLGGDDFNFDDLVRTCTQKRLQRDELKACEILKERCETWQREVRDLHGRVEAFSAEHGLTEDECRSVTTAATPESLSPLLNLSQQIAQPAFSAALPSTPAKQSSMVRSLGGNGLISSPFLKQTASADTVALSAVTPESVDAVQQTTVGFSGQPDDVEVHMLGFDNDKLPYSAEKTLLSLRRDLQPQGSNMKPQLSQLARGREFVRLEQQLRSDGFHDDPSVVHELKMILIRQGEEQAQLVDKLEDVKRDISNAIAKLSREKPNYSMRAGAVSLETVLESIQAYLTHSFDSTSDGTGTTHPATDTEAEEIDVAALVTQLSVLFAQPNRQFRDPDGVKVRVRSFNLQFLFS